jgi:diphthine synthase
MLFLIGLGLQKNDITIGALDSCKRCTEVYADRHTSFIPSETLDYIQEVAGKRVTNLSRQDMEENVKDLVQRAKSMNIAILTGGDPLIATTHKILFMEAKAQGQPIVVQHSSSIMTVAIGESGLDFYRFGRSCTVPHWTEHYKPVSFYETIGSNMMINAHTLLLLDYDSKTGSTISISEALDTLEAAEAHYKNGIISKNRELIIMHNMQDNSGANTRQIISTTFERARDLQLGGMNIMVICSDLTDIEREALAACSTKV